MNLKELEIQSKQKPSVNTKVESVLGFKTDLNQNEINELLEKCMTTYRDPKAIDVLKTMIENLKFEKGEEENDLKLHLRNDGKTKFYNLVQNDKLTPTISAYYYCKKSAQAILSDK
jgi:hypothetical protein